MRHGDFSLLTEDYLKYRPDYAPIILKSVIGLIGKSLKEIDVADVGAGTGIWTRMLDGYEFKSIKAVEPNDQMRLLGEKFSTFLKWLENRISKVKNINALYQNRAWIAKNKN